MRKAITPVISIIVLLLITVALVGGGWLYISGYFETMMKVIDIPPGSAYCRGNEATVVIRNPGQSVINNSDHKAMLGLFHDHEDAVGAWRFEGDGNATEDSSPNSNTGSIYGDTVLLMHFDEGSGNITNDETSYGNEGTLQGDLETSGWKSGGECQSGSCLEFDGAGDYVSVADDDSLDFPDNSFSVSLWYKFPIGESNPKWSFDKGNVWTYAGYGIAHWTTSDPVTPCFYVNSTASGRLSRCAGSINRGEWGHVVWTIDRSANLIKAYTNGEYNGQRDISSLGDISNSYPLDIGRHSGSYFNGSIDEVAIYDRALTLEEVNSIYSEGKAKFIEYVLGKSGNAIEFDGDGDYVELGSEVAMDLEHATISWFMKRGEEDYETIFSKTKESTCALIEIDKNTNKFRLEPNRNNNFSLYLDTKINTYDGQFHHYAITFRRTGNDNNLTLYVDGIEADNQISTDGDFDEYLNIKYIGHQGRQVTYIYGDYFNGTIDEVVILNTALTPEQIADDLTPACSCSGNTCQCGDLTITRTSGEGYFFPYFNGETIQPKGSVRMTDYNCMGDSCTYRITSVAASVEATVECS